mgnify:CR=1 FL=1
MKTLFSHRAVFGSLILFAFIGIGLATAAEPTKAALESASAAIIAEQGPSYPAVCVVSDETLEPGETLDFVYQGQLVRFCCKGCRKDFEKDPATFMAKIAALKEAAKPKTHGRKSHDH